MEYPTQHQAEAVELVNLVKRTVALGGMYPNEAILIAVDELERYSADPGLTDEECEFVLRAIDYLLQS